MPVVRHDAAMHMRAEDGSTVRAHLQASLKTQSGARARETRRQLAVPPVPSSVAYLLEWFGELSAGRNEGMSGPGPITHQHIESWARLTHRSPSLEEINAILRLDSAWRNAVHDGLAEKAAAPTPGQQKKRPIVMSTAPWPEKKEAKADG